MKFNRGESVWFHPHEWGNRTRRSGVFLWAQNPNCYIPIAVPENQVPRLWCIECEDYQSHHYLHFESLSHSRKNLFVRKKGPGQLFRCAGCGLVRQWG